MKALFIGLTTIDNFYYLDGFPEEDTKKKTSDHVIDIGGPATNAAFAFAALGGEATLLSLVGKQSFTTFMLQKFEEFGIKHLDLNPHFEQNPEIASIWVNTQNGSRTIATLLPREQIRIDPPPIDIFHYDIICVDGFYGKFLVDFLPKVQGNIPIVFDGGSVKAFTTEVLNHVDYPIFSEKFSLTHYDHPGDYLAEIGKEHYAITKGEKPIEVYEHGRTSSIQVPPIQAKDTLGAGDIFHGAFCRYILEEGTTFTNALEKARNIASLSCTCIGPREWAKHL